MENAAAGELNKIFTRYGHDPVERIPVLGRTGPDLTYNDTVKLIVDVKSRKEVPKSYLPGAEEILYDGELIAVRLEDLDSLASLPAARVRQIKPLKIPHEYWAHMDAWTQSRMPDGITGVIMHLPGKGSYMSRAPLLVHKNDLRRLLCRIQNLSCLPELQMRWSLAHWAV
jgi:hypothetical protein